MPAANPASVHVFKKTKKQKKKNKREQANAAGYVFIYSIVNVVMWYQLGSNKSEHPIPFPM